MICCNLALLMLSLGRNLDVSVLKQFAAKIWRFISIGISWGLYLLANKTLKVSTLISCSHSQSQRFFADVSLNLRYRYMAGDHVAILLSPIKD